MSISVKNSNNEWVQVAGQGRAEYGASTVRRGTVTFTIDPQTYITVPVTFDTPMPDADYLVDVSFPTQQPISYYVVDNRTKNGFNLFIKNEGAGSADASVTYTAFKLYTDTEYNNLLNNAVLTSDVTDSVTNGDMNPVTSNAVAEALSVIDSPITKVGTAINGDRFWSKRTGNVVEIMIDGTTGSNIPCAQSVVVAKVPKNALTISDVCIEIDSKSLVSAPESGHKRAWVDSTGNVCVFIVMPDLAATYTGNIYIGGTYITTD